MTQAPVPAHTNACLILADGTVFWGKGIGAIGTAIGEICFNTAMTGYQEVLTDPSYAGQIITFTFPHIGNVGCNPEDIEAHKPHAAGLVLREDITQPSSFRSSQHLNDWLKQMGIAGICGIDTRALTRYIRDNGAQNAAIVNGERGVTSDQLEKAKEALQCAPNMEGMELACTVTTAKPYKWTEGEWVLPPAQRHVPRSTFHVVAIDFGEKLNILRSLTQRGCNVTVVPATMSAVDILKLKPDGVFLSNGPGDPAATAAYAETTLKMLLSSPRKRGSQATDKIPAQGGDDDCIPIFGICLGHQLLSLALGAKTGKMHQGHRGANHPVKNLQTGTVEITSQNHGFQVLKESLPKDVEMTHVSLFDGCLEGLRHKTKPVFSVQYHPESSPGPNDSKYLFDQFIGMMCNKDKKRRAG